MKRFFTHYPSRLPRLNPYVFIVLSLIIYSDFHSLMAQSSKPLKAKEILPRLKLDQPEEENDFDQIVYEVLPAAPLSKELLPESNPSIHMASVEENPIVNEPADAAFEIGKDTGVEGFRVAKIDKNGSVLLAEDNIEPILYVRFQKVVTRYLEARLYSESGRLLSSTKKRNLMCGTEFRINYSKWPKGTYNLDVRLDNGMRYTKKIIKNKNVEDTF